MSFLDIDFRYSVFKVLLQVFLLHPFKNSGSLLLSHAVSNIVPSAAQVLTIVFGMCTGVSPERIATANSSAFASLDCLDSLTALQPLLLP